MTTASTTPLAEAYEDLARYLQEHGRFMLDDRGVPMIDCSRATRDARHRIAVVSRHGWTHFIQGDKDGLIVGPTAVKVMIMIYPWVVDAIQEKIRTILKVLGYPLPDARPGESAVSPSESGGWEVTTLPLFTRLHDVHDWFSSMRFAFRNLWDDGLLCQLDPVAEDENEDQATGHTFEADHCEDCCEIEYEREVQRDVHRVIEALQFIATEIQDAINFLEAHGTAAGDRLAMVEQS